MGQIKNIKLHIVTDIKICVEKYKTKFIMVEKLTRRLSTERFRSISFSKRPKLRKRSISDSNLLLESNLFVNNSAQERQRSYTSVSKTGNVGALRKRSVSQIDLHGVNIFYNKPTSRDFHRSTSNRNTHCLEIREVEEADGAEDSFENHVEGRQNSEDLDAEEDHLKKVLGDEDQVDGWSWANNEEKSARDKALSGRRGSDEDDKDQKRSQEGKEKKKNPTLSEATSPIHRKRKTGLSSFSLTKFLTGKTRSRLRSFEPDDPRQLIMAIRNRDINRVRYILEQCPVDVNGCNSKGVAALHEAALDDQCNIIELLLQHEANVNQKDHDGLTCLDYAVVGGHFECASYLIDNGASVGGIANGMPTYFND